MADVGFTPVRGNRNEIANTPLEDGQFLFETEIGNGNKVYADVLRDDGTVERVGIMGNYVDRNGDTINGDLTVNGRLTVNDKIIANGDMEFTSTVGTTVNLRDIFKYVYPVGSIYMSTNNTNPASLFGGSWVAWGSGRVPVGIDINDSDFNAIEKTGGAKRVTLTSSQSGVPAHSHGLNAHTHTYDKSNTETGTIQSVQYDASKPPKETYDKSAKAGEINHTHSLSYATVNSGQASGSTANNSALNATESHNNLQPYITCYMWKRVQ